MRFLTPLPVLVDVGSLTDAALIHLPGVVPVRKCVTGLNILSCPRSALTVVPQK